MKSNGNLDLLQVGVNANCHKVKSRDFAMPYAVSKSRIDAPAIRNRVLQRTNNHSELVDT